jgi:hypothetical protein
VVFFAVRALLALIPALTVSLLGGRRSAGRRLLFIAVRCDVATQRSFFMSAVMPIAVIVDRRAVTFRTLAVSGTRPRLGSRSATGPPPAIRKSLHVSHQNRRSQSRTPSGIFSFEINRAKNGWRSQQDSNLQPTE